VLDAVKACLDESGMHQVYDIYLLLITLTMAASVAII
jgi:hypothetical protein